ncbi:WD40 repeat domain-containing protein, partial [Catenuloplanes japonicus]|uniref:WD40 repeat domain-containing protein n=1 Tax=Catenuloplanes japonicus TaxID=33876 RepID=UPI0038BBF919
SSRCSATPSACRVWTPTAGHSESATRCAEWLIAQADMRAVVSSTNRFIATVDDHETIQVRMTATNKPVATFSGHTGRVISLRFSPKDDTLASAAADGTLRLWDMPSD